MKVVRSITLASLEGWEELLVVMVVVLMVVLVVEVNTGCRGRIISLLLGDHSPAV